MQDNGGGGSSTNNDEDSGPWTGTTAAAAPPSDAGNDVMPVPMAETTNNTAGTAPYRGFQRSVIPREGNDSTKSHEIGLVSVGISSDPHYIGPSSGYFLARMLLSPPTQRNRSIYGVGAIYGPMHGRDVPPIYNSQNQQQSEVEPVAISYPFPAELVDAVQAPLRLPSRDHCNQLCDVFFEVINVQYPVLHRPSFTRTLDQVFSYEARTDRAEQFPQTGRNDPQAPEPTAYFQVFMVLAIAATIQSRRLKARIPGELYCLSALQYFDRLNVENSLPGLQCLLLLLLCTMHCPNMKLNVWYLNYQCIAATLDLGIQRTITTSSGISFVEQEMRTRLFWVVFTLDRTIATMMGRPIGLRDEACDLRLPMDVDDDEVALAGGPRQGVNNNNNTNTPISPSTTTTPMTFAIHLFKLAKLNSEIKYVANSVVRSAPSYAYPPVADIHAWRTNLLGQLDEWASAIPNPGNSESYLHTMCQLRYHALRMLLLRPSPAIPNPSHDCLRACYDSAVISLRLLHQLYRRNMLVHSWITLHTLVLSTITVLYCLQGVPALAREIELDTVMSDVGAGLAILSATGEYWTSAKRCRDILEGLTRTTMSWVKNLGSPLQHQQPPMNPHQHDLTNIITQRLRPDMTDGLPGTAGGDAGGGGGGMAGFGMDLDPSIAHLHRGAMTPSLMDVHTSHAAESHGHDVWGSGNSGGGGAGSGGSLIDQLDINAAQGDTSVNVDTMMRALFEDYISNYTAFGHDPVL
ncbi:hypothetical protein SEUCBS140593_000237 [Sporothrix eucalyptigena]|uniref:Xylanolytic transcriptional activator regulatory domain-containing protein n=1 Tax=Sporothrix eucalyptigena TaxID=1812306 RepID=A0ABP0AN10_9PEZI